MSQYQYNDVPVAQPYGQPASQQPTGQYAPPQQYDYAAPPQYNYDANPAAKSAMYPPIKQATDETPIAPSAERFDYSGSKCRDGIFAVLFIVHILAMFAVGAMYGHYVIDQSSDINGNVYIENAYTLIFCLGGAAVSAMLFAIVWLKVIKVYADVIIKISLLMSSLWLAVGAGACLYYGSYVGALIAVVFIGLNLLYYYLVKDRIPFTQAIIKAASASIQDNGSTVCVTYGMAVLQVLWVCYWSFAVLAVYLYFQSKENENSNDNQQQVVGGIGAISYFLLLISFYWTGQVLKNICHVTTSGAVASWWLLPQVASPVGPAFKRAMTTSFGSICLGSFIVAVLSAMREMARMAKNSASRSNNAGAACVACLFECMLRCIERLMNFFNVYAFTQVAIYGKTFMQAAKDTWALFVARGWTVLINDDLTGMVLFMGALGGGVVGFIAGGGLSLVIFEVGTTVDTTTDPVFYIGAVLGFLIGFIMVSLVMNVVYSAVATTLVLWAENPNELGRNRPEYYSKLQETARSRHPGQEW